MNANEKETTVQADGTKPLPNSNNEIRQSVRIELERLLNRCGKDPKKITLTPVPDVHPR